MAGRTLTIDIKTADAQTLAALKRIQKELKDTGQVADRTKRQGMGLGDALGGLAIGAGIGASIAEFEEAETTLRKTEAVIRSTGNAAGVSAEQQAKMVDEFSKLAAVDDEVVAGGANILRTFTKVKGEAFEPALGAALDLSAALGTDLQSASLQVGKALNDPIKGVTALTRAGVSFTQAQKDQIKTMQEAGDIAGAQQLILAELETQFGGQAEAAATDSAKMKVAFGNAAESLGGALAPALSTAAAGAEKLSSAFQSLPQPVQQGAVALGAVAFIAPKVARGYESITAATTDATGATTRMGKALGAAGIATAAAAGVFALNEYRKSTTGLKVDIEALMGATDEAIAKELMRVAQFADQGDFEKVGRQNIDALYAMQDALEANGQKALPELTAAIKVVEAEQARAAARTKEYGAAQDGAADAVDGAADANRDYAGTFEAVNNALADTYTDGVRANQVFADYLQTSLDVNAAVVGVADAQERLADSSEAVADADQARTDASEAVADARRDVADAERGVAEALEGVEDARRNVTEAEEEAVVAAEAVTTATLELAAAQDEVANGSDDLRDALERVGDAEDNLADAQADSLTAQQDLTAAREGYGDVLADLARDAGGAADDVLSAEIRLREAQQNLAGLGKPDKDGNVKPVTADERLAAEIAIREAQRRLEAAREREAEARAEYERQQAAGVEGSDAVVAAHAAVEGAADNEAEAEKDLAAAREGVTLAQEAAAARVVEAQENVEEALDNRRAADQRVIDARQSVIDANGEVQRAAEGVDAANRGVSSAIGGVISAQGRYAEAKEAAKTAQGEVEKAVDDVKDALDDQATAWAGMLLTFKFDGPLRKALRDVKAEMDELAGTYDVNVNIGGNAADAILSGVSNPFLEILAAATGQQSTGGRSAGGTKTTADAGAVPQVPGPAGKTITINAYGIDDPAATAEWIYARADWELGLLGVA